MGACTTLPKQLKIKSTQPQNTYYSNYELAYTLDTTFNFDKFCFIESTLRHWCSPKQTNSDIIRIIVRYFDKLETVTRPIVLVIKIVLVGDAAIGKSCLLTICTGGSYPTEYIPTVFDNYAEDKEIGFGLTATRVDLWDTAGSDTFDRVRPLAYRDANIFIVCFAVNLESSKTNVTEKWIKEIRKEHKPIVLCGLKADLSEHLVQDQTFGNNLALQIGAECYVQCSAYCNDGIEKVINTAAIVAIKHKQYLK
eukprot:519995_1